MSHTGREVTSPQEVVVTTASLTCCERAHGITAASLPPHTHTHRNSPGGTLGSMEFISYLLPPSLPHLIVCQDGVLMDGVVLHSQDTATQRGLLIGAEGSWVSAPGGMLYRRPGLSRCLPGNRSRSLATGLFVMERR